MVTFLITIIIRRRIITLLNTDHRRRRISFPSEDLKMVGGRFVIRVVIIVNQLFLVFFAIFTCFLCIRLNVYVKKMHATNPDPD